nr:MAG TPA: hypothetical protein [Caudoviricetes sp.]
MKPPLCYTPTINIIELKELVPWVFIIMSSESLKLGKYI